MKRKGNRERRNTNTETINIYGDRLALKKVLSVKRKKPAAPLGVTGFFLKGLHKLEPLEFFELSV